MFWLLILDQLAPPSVDLNIPAGVVGWVLNQPTWIEANKVFEFVGSKDNLAVPDQAVMRPGFSNSVKVAPLSVDLNIPLKLGSKL